MKYEYHYTYKDHNGNERKLFSRKQEQMIDYYLDMTNGILNLDNIMNDEIIVDNPEETLTFKSVGGIIGHVESTIKEWGLLK